MFKEKGEMWEEIEKERLNMVHWSIFYNKPDVFTYLIKEEAMNHAGLGFRGDHPPYVYKYKTKSEVEK